ncbi:MAG TPA: Trk family potassium uptake protein, partial [Clostridiales bacterium UBA8960]|nr:Trk family potassium uptake protein [Clostridiales bacterium UBA8960]
ALNQFSIAGVIRLTRYVVIATLFFELIGAFILSFRFVPEFGWSTGIFYSVFHSISAFCNAGFDIMGNYQSMTGFAKDPLVNITIMSLIVFGGLGFAVLADFTRTQKIRQWSLHTKLVLSVSLSLILLGAIVVFAIEHNNPDTMGSFTYSEKIIASLFHSITPRTAGFNTIDIASMKMPTRFLTMVLMFIGGSPGSTAGGIKTTTFGMMMLSVIAVFKGTENINFANRRISRDSINKALAVIFISTIWIVIMTFLLIVAESDMQMEEVLFESLSAFGTVGLSMGITPYLNVVGKMIITIMMFFGRLGPLTIVIAISRNKSSKGDLLKYPEGKIIVG